MRFIEYLLKLQKSIPTLGEEYKRPLSLFDTAFILAAVAAVSQRSEDGGAAVDGRCAGGSSRTGLKDPLSTAGGNYANRAAVRPAFRTVGCSTRRCGMESAEI